MRTHCKRGHPYTYEWVSKTGRVTRRCRECHLARMKARYHRMREGAPPRPNYRPPDVPWLEWIESKLLPPNEQGCRLWTGSKISGKPDSYGALKINGKAILAHRAVYMLYHGVELTPDEFVMHSCDEPRCAEITHLSVGTRQDNVDDAIRKGRFKVFGRVPKKHADCHPDEKHVAKGLCKKCYDKWRYQESKKRAA